MNIFFRALTLITGLAAAMPAAGCFSPGYDEGGFLCSYSPHTCPAGYGCVCEGGKSVCRKGAALAPCAVGKDQGQDSPPRPDLPRKPDSKLPDRGSPPVDLPQKGLICGKAEVLAKGVMTNPGTSDLALDITGHPVVAYLDSAGVLSWKRHTTKGWPASPISYKGIRTTVVASAIDSKNQLHLLYRALENGTLKPALHHAYIVMSPHNMEGIQALASGLDVQHVDLAGSPALGSTLYVVSTPPPKFGATLNVATLGRLSPPTAGTMYTFTRVCSRNVGLNRAPRVAAARRSGKNYISTSRHDEKAQSWHRSSYVDPNMVSCTSYRGFGSPSLLPTPSALAFNNLGLPETAFVQVPKGQQQGPLVFGYWLLGSTKLTTQTLRSGNTVSGWSVGLATRKNGLPCVSFYEKDSFGKQFSLRVACKVKNDTKTPWQYSGAADKVLATVFSDHETRLMVDSADTLHLLYAVPGPGLAAELRYTTCRLNL